VIINLQTITEETHLDETLPQEWWQAGDPSHQVLGLSGPLEVHLKVSKAADKFLVEGTLSGRVRVRCDRCLEAFDSELRSTLNVYLVRKPTTAGEEDVELLDEEMEVDFIRGETIDLTEIIREQIYLYVPMKCVCKSSCRGLCPKCGTNLNVAACLCDRQGGHSVFSKLEKLKVEGEH
jgi:uncharacterized protein